MKALISLALWGAVLYIAFLAFKKLTAGKGEQKENTWPVYAKKTLLNEKEQIVFNRLSEAFPDWIVLAQVALSQVVTVKTGKENGIYRNKIYRKVLDFVICKPDTSVIAVFELNGNSHDSPTRSKSDEDKEKALRAAGIRLIPINTKDLPNGPTLRSLIQ